ncbi:hypothetical protein AB0B21_28550 [Streptomyces rimosus]|uniref:hypothetical protein n=1 Tax=Streptomyces rimosus TaxID=1927 RepID=UPI0005185AB5|nr:hypothetical protein [Streptomyces rimosus]
MPDASDVEGLTAGQVSAWLGVTVRALRHFVDASARTHGIDPEVATSDIELLGRVCGLGGRWMCGP